MKRNKSYANKQPLLYLVATPIGNLKEFSFRAIDILNNVDLVAAEDKRNAHLLLSHFQIKKPLYCLKEHNEKEASQYLVNFIKEGKTIAYMSDAGYPGISDPGYYLVNEMIKNDIPVSTISGSSAFINALVASGMESDHFLFYGFLSSKDKQAFDQLETLKNIKQTLIFYEAPHRIIRTLNIFKQVFGNRKICLARELTKINEEYIRGTVDELCLIDQDSLKGEMVLIVEGSKNEEKLSDEQINEKIAYFVKLGLSKKDAITIVSEQYCINKNYIKKLILGEEKNGN